MKIEFVNHACYVLETGDIRLICDPWLEGRCFNDGWGLLSPTAFQYEDFETITHVWFSHEHPDHFSPPNLRKIPEEYRRRITILFQETLDKKLVQYCEKLGFKNVIELDPRRWLTLADGVDILCQPWEGFEDSWLAVKTPDATVLNLNDCPIFDRQEAQSVKDIVGQVDVLFTQFSISSWDGNREETARLRAGARKMLRRAVMHAQVFRPEYIVPFASFIWLCHEENAYMNDAMLSMEEVYHDLSEQAPATTMLMYPGDQWEYGDPVSSELAVERYSRDQQSIPERTFETSAVIDEDELIHSSKDYCRKIIEGCDYLRLRLHLASESAKWRNLRRTRLSGRASLLQRLVAMSCLRLEPAYIWVPDHEHAYSFDLKRALQPSSRSRSDCDVEVGSQSLHYGFRFLWGGETLQINGRFQEIYPEGKMPLFHYYYLAGELNAGKGVAWKTLVHDLVRKLRNRLQVRSSVEPEFKLKSAGAS